MTTTELNQKQHALYRFYADDGALLYVGITSNPSERWEQHRADKPWWNEVRGITLETYPDRESVLSAERRAIEVETPRHNKQRPKLHHRSTPPKTKTEPKYVWLCEQCGAQVANKTGYIHISMLAINKHETAKTQWDKEHADDLYLTLTELLSIPNDADWRIHHRACDPNIESIDYVIEVERARTAGQLLDWTIHLSQKSWYQTTNWPSFIHRSVPMVFA